VGGWQSASESERERGGAGRGRGRERARERASARERQRARVGEREKEGRREGGVGEKSTSRESTVTRGGREATRVLCRVTSAVVVIACATTAGDSCHESAHLTLAS
jgi:hypothetical protein